MPLIDWKHRINPFFKVIPWNKTVIADRDKEKRAKECFNDEEVLKQEGTIESVWTPFKKQFERVCPWFCLET